VGELLGRTDFSAAGLTRIPIPHPTLPGVTTTLLGGTSETAHRLMAVGGIKWNVTDAWLFNAHVLRPVTTTGFTTAWTPAVTLDYFFQQ
jgi:hypothetical protein